MFQSVYDVKLHLIYVRAVIYIKKSVTLVHYLHYHVQYELYLRLNFHGLNLTSVASPHFNLSMYNGLRY
jgi:hypothetical protein